MYKFVEIVEVGLCASGAYALLIELGEPLRVKAGTKSALLAPGGYVYCGSAKGPGGIGGAARTTYAARQTGALACGSADECRYDSGAWVFPGRSECEVNEELAGWPIPLDGFGSSDCRRCRAHLRFWPRGEPRPREWEGPPRRQKASLTHWAEGART